MHLFSNVGLSLSSGSSRKLSSDRPTIDKHITVKKLDPKVYAVFLSRPEKRKLIPLCQDSISFINNCKKPSITSIYGPCIGAGIKVDLGITADVGVLNRINKLVGNDSVVREWTFTGCKFTSFISKRFSCVAYLNEAVKLAKQIARKSLIAVIGAKLLLNNARDHTITDSLEYAKLWNQAFHQSEDIVAASLGLLSIKKN
uniref:Antitermination protein n=1 Tax=Syphacia muris TaxID=451379 RepID=A0A0N5AE89_9BILA